MGVLATVYEAANIAPLPSLPRLVSDGSGSGITSVVVLQSLAQARDRWGVHAASTIWDTCTTKLIFGGLGTHDDLEDISRITGTVKDGDAKFPKPVMTAAAIRAMGRGRVLLLHKGLRPAVLKLKPYFRNREQQVAIPAPKNSAVASTNG